MVKIIDIIINAFDSIEFFFTILLNLYIKKLNAKELYDKIKLLIENEQVRINYQRKSYQNFYLTHQKSCKEIDEYRNEILIKKTFLNWF